MKRACSRCGKTFEAKRSTAQYCSSSCRVRASQIRKSSAEVVNLPQKSVEPAGLAATVEKQLRDAGKLDSYAGQQALFMARRLERSAMDTGAAVAALSKELDRLMTAVMADVEAEPDALDEVQGQVLQMRGRRRA